MRRPPLQSGRSMRRILLALWFCSLAHVGTANAGGTSPLSVHSGRIAQGETPLQEDVGAAATNGSPSSNDIVLDTRRRGSEMSMQARFIGGYQVDALDARSDDGEISRVKGLYADFQDDSQRIRARIGRQAGSSGGILGRFDGALFSYQHKPSLRFNAMSGHPVDSSQHAPRTDRSFRGVSADIGNPSQAVNAVAFLVEQEERGTLERRAVGGEARYLDAATSLRGFLDYDLLDRQLDAAILLADWQLAEGVSVNGSIDIRADRILSTYNAIQGRDRDSIAILRTRFNEDSAMRNIADDGAAGRAYSVGLEKRLNGQWRIAGETQVSLWNDISNAATSATADRGHGRAVGLHLIDGGLDGDYRIDMLGLRYSEASGARTVSMSWEKHYAVGAAWRINPQLRVDRRSAQSHAPMHWAYVPALVMDFKWRKQDRLELQAGGEWSTHGLKDAVDDARALHLQAAYRAEF